MYEISKLNTAALRLWIAMMMDENFAERSTKEQAEVLGLGKRQRIYEAQKALLEAKVLHIVTCRGKKSNVSLVSTTSKYIYKLGIAGSEVSSVFVDEVSPNEVLPPVPNLVTPLSPFVAHVPELGTPLNGHMSPKQVHPPVPNLGTSPQNGNNLLEKCKEVDEIDETGTPSNRRSPRRNAQIEVLIEVWSHFWPEQYPLTPKSAITLLNLCENCLTDLYYEIKDLHLRKPDIESPLGYIKKKLASQERIVHVPPPVSQTSQPATQEWDGERDGYVQPSEEWLEKKRQAKEMARKLHPND